MPTPCDKCPLRRCDYFLPMTDDELAFMRRFKAPTARSFSLYCQEWAPGIRRSKTAAVR
jgi:hypothetical protein